MSIQWTFIAACLYVEITIVVVMMLPIASPRKWSRLFRSRLFSYIESHAIIYFYVVLSIMGLLLVDSIREMRKYSSSTEGGHVHIGTELKGNVKLFRAQRNFYITGFSIFLVFVIRRLVTMILVQADLLDKSARLIQQAEETTRLAKESILSREMERNAVEDDEELKRLQHELQVQQQARRAQEEMIKDMTSEIDTWRYKYEKLSEKLGHKGAGDDDM